MTSSHHVTAAQDGVTGLVLVFESFAHVQNFGAFAQSSPRDMQQNIVLVFIHGFLKTTNVTSSLKILILQFE